MRRSNYFTMISAAFMLALSISCTEKDQCGSISEGDNVFSASIEQMQTKTTITDEFKVYWENGELIYINGMLYNATPRADATKADFSNGTTIKPESPYHAIYPYTLYVKNQYVFPTVQFNTGNFGAPMYAESSTESLEFKNICGVLCFSLKGTDKVRSITVTANEALCGAFEMENATSVKLTGTGKSVTLDCGTEGVQLNESVATNFYVYLPPKSYSTGMKIFIKSTDGDFFWKTTTTTANVERNNIYTFNWNVEFSPTLPGEFSVSSREKVHFSKGNLRATYDGSKYTWGFYDKQYIKNASGNTTIDSQTKGASVDLFGWSTNSTNYGISTSENDSDYSGDFKDWGTAIDNKGTWRTLSNEEWTYLFGTSDQRNGKTKSGVTVDGQAGCTVIVPDDWDITSYPLQTEYSMTSTPMTWEQAQMAGMVCFPTPSIRWGSFVPSYYNNLGWYWSSSDEYEHDSDAEDCAYCVYFDSEFDPIPGDYYIKDSGCAVRLVTKAE